MSVMGGIASAVSGAGTSAATHFSSNTGPKGNVDYFLKIEGIQGESTDSKHHNEVELLSWSFGASQQGTFATGSGGGAGKVAMQDFNFTMHVDKATPKCLLSCANGEHIKTATLVARKAGKEQQEYLKVTLSDVLISGVSILGDGSILPVAQVSFNFAKIEMEYKEQKPDGSLGGVTKVGYDLKQNKAV